jgi:insertion element IS1 protein InsB
VYRYRSYLLEVQQITEMALSVSGIRDTARVLKISPTRVIEKLKRSLQLKAVNEARLLELEPIQTIVQLCQWEDVEAELDEMWSFVRSKGQVLAYVLADHQDAAFLELKTLLEPFGYHAILHRWLRSL